MIFAYCHQYDDIISFKYFPFQENSKTLGKGTKLLHNIKYSKKECILDYSCTNKYGRPVNEIMDAWWTTQKLQKNKHFFAPKDKHIEVMNEGKKNTSVSMNCFTDINS